MTFNQAVTAALRKYATFSGRARRSEFWWFYLFTFLAGIVSSVADAALGVAVDNSLEVVGLVTSLLLFLPSLAVTARRLHDTGRTGWWMLIPVLPFAVFLVLLAVAVGVSLSGAAPEPGNDLGTNVAGVAGVALLVGLAALAAGIVLLVLLCQDSAPSPNKYGPSPKPPLTPTYQGWPGGYSTYPYDMRPSPPGSGQQS